jgi:hypothetical protein
MSDSDTSVDDKVVDSDSNTTIIFDPVFGNIVDVCEYLSADHESYAVVHEEIDTGHLRIVYELDPFVRLLWVFRAVDSAVWGDAMWLDNEDVIDVSEMIGEEEVGTLLVTEFVSGRHVLKFLTHDSDVNEWRVYLMLHEDVSEDSESISDESEIDTDDVEEPLLDEDVSL